MKRGVKGKKKLQTKISKKGKPQKSFFNSAFFWVGLLLLIIAFVLIVNSISGGEPGLSPEPVVPGAVAPAEGLGPAEGITNFITGAIDVIREAGRPVFDLLFGATTGEGESLVVQVLAFALTMLVIYGLLDTVHIFGDNSWINFGIAAIVGILGIRFLPDGFLEVAALPSSALVGALVLGIPFILAFFLINRVQSRPLVRRALWAGYGAIIFVLFFYNWNQLGWKSWLWIYPAIVLACALAFAFDGKLQNFMHRASFARVVEYTSDTQIARITAEIRDLQGALAAEPNANKRKSLQEKIEAKKDAVKQLSEYI